MNSTTIEMVLRNARNLIAKPGQWVQKTAATAADGFRVRIDNPEACCFCMTAAVRVSVARLVPATDNRDVIEREAFYALDRAVRRTQNPDHQASRLGLWNDDPARTHEEVLAAFDYAIREISSQSG